jgi:thioredoxin-like negative regulator of GroEL
MGKVLAFDNCRGSTRYREVAQELDTLLETLTQELTGVALNLAAAGEWQEWDTSQPAGSVLELDPDDLRQTDDALVRRVMELCDRAEELREHLVAVRATRAPAEP